MKYSNLSGELEFPVARLVVAAMLKIIYCEPDAKSLKQTIKRVIENAFNLMYTSAVFSDDEVTLASTLTWANLLIEGLPRAHLYAGISTSLFHEQVDGDLVDGIVEKICGDNFVVIQSKKNDFMVVGARGGICFFYCPNSGAFITHDTLGDFSTMLAFLLDCKSKDNYAVHSVVIKNELGFALPLPAGNAMIKIPTDLGRFTDQFELKHAYNQYVEVYYQQHDKVKPFPLFNGYRVDVAIDGAAVYYSHEAALFGEGLELKEKGHLGINIARRLMDCASYFLAQNILPSAVPDTLRVCLTICHQNIHWTSVVGLVRSFRQAYTGIYLYSFQFPSDSSLNETIRFNNAKNRILNFISMIRSENLDLRNIAEIDAAKAVCSYFLNLPITLDHYDSLNSEHYHARIIDGLESLAPFFSVRKNDCHVQRGNTCGDHAVINLVVASLLDGIPLIDDGSHNDLSSTLREFTNSLHSDRAFEQAKNILAAFSSADVLKQSIVLSLNIAAKSDQANLEQQAISQLQTVMRHTKNAIPIFEQHNGNYTIDPYKVMKYIYVYNNDRSNQANQIIEIDQIERLIVELRELFFVEHLNGPLLESILSDYYRHHDSQSGLYKISVNEKTEQRFIGELTKQLGHPQCTSVSIMSFFYELKRKPRQNNPNDALRQFKSAQHYNAGPVMLSCAIISLLKKYYLQKCHNVNLAVTFASELFRYEGEGTQQRSKEMKLI